MLPFSFFFFFYISCAIDFKVMKGEIFVEKIFFEDKSKRVASNKGRIIE